jgi:ABC-type phosphate/phosphonate transport system substrate-binding protein
MPIVIYTLILFFTILIISQIFLASFHSSVIEGLEIASPQYQPYNPNNAFILAQQNAGNIEVLRQQIEDLSPLSKEVQDISGNVAELQSQLHSMAAAQQQYAQQMLPSKTPTITGAVNS